MKREQIKGKVVKSFGRGARFVEIYSEKLGFLLGFEPFPGTLNLEVDLLERDEFISALRPLTLDSFEIDNQSYGIVVCYKVLINNEIKGAIVVPKKTTHNKNIIEVIAPVELRKYYKLSDNSFISLNYLK